MACRNATLAIARIVSPTMRVTTCRPLAPSCASRVGRSRTGSAIPWGDHPGRGLGRTVPGRAGGGLGGLFGSQVSRTYWPLKIPPVEWGGRFVLKRFAQLSGSRLKRGPEDEPIGLALESMRWYGLFGRFGDRDKDWWAGLAEVQMPVLAVSAAGDHQDPAWACRKLYEQLGSEHKQFVCLGREQGFSGNFGHVEMLVSKAAQVEVWPLVARWLTDQQTPLLTPAPDLAAVV